MLFKGWSVLLLLLLLLLQWLAPEKLRGCGAILVNSKGQRFVDELTTRDKVTDAIMKQVSPRCAIHACAVLHLLPGLTWGVLIWLVALLLGPRMLAQTAVASGQSMWLRFATATGL
jgi:hypothetical protein